MELPGGGTPSRVELPDRVKLGGEWNSSSIWAQVADFLMASFSHHGRRRRADIIPVPGLPGYYLHRIRDRHGRAALKKVRPHRKDTDRSPFLVEYHIRRKLRGRGGGWGRPLKLRPKRNGKKKPRWDLAMCLGKSNCAYYHRVVGLAVCPCTTDEEGWEIDPYFLTPDWFPWYEVHHGQPKDTHNCKAGNLFPLWWLYHRSLERQ